jgi:hypothetical protein
MPPLDVYEAFAFKDSIFLPEFCITIEKCLIFGENEQSLRKYPLLKCPGASVPPRPIHSRYKWHLSAYEFETLHGLGILSYIS